jgi:DNA invertase Pin-like site-specific DNA recombinase
MYPSSNRYRSGCIGLTLCFFPFDVARPKARSWDALVVVKLDRLTRSVRDLCTLVESFERGSVNFVSLAESVDTGSAAGKLFLNITGALGQWEREVIGERTAHALAHLKAQGRRISGRAPFGFTFGEDGAVVPCEREQ